MVCITNLFTAFPATAFEFEQCTWYVDYGNSWEGREGMIWVDREIINGYGNVWKSVWCFDDFSEDKSKRTYLSLTPREKEELKKYHCHKVKIKAELDKVNNGFGYQASISNIHVIKDEGLVPRCNNKYPLKD